MSKRAEEYLHQFDQYGIPITSWTWEDMVECYDDSRKQAEKDIIAIIESRIAEILGDAQPRPTIRIELKELITRIKEEKK